MDNIKVLLKVHKTKYTLIARAENMEPIYEIHHMIRITIDIQNVQQNIQHLNNKFVDWKWYKSNLI